jgi:hypothetical protein
LHLYRSAQRASAKLDISGGISEHDKSCLSAALDLQQNRQHCSCRQLQVERIMIGLRSALPLAALLSAVPVRAQFGGGRFGVLNAKERHAAMTDFGFDTTRAASPIAG